MVWDAARGLVTAGPPDSASVIVLGKKATRPVRFVPGRSVAMSTYVGCNGSGNAGEGYCHVIDPSEKKFRFVYSAIPMPALMSLPAVVRQKLRGEPPRAATSALAWVSRSTRIETSRL